MSDETTANAGSLPRTNAFPAAAGAVSAPRDRDEALSTAPDEVPETPARGVFGKLVEGDGDITGLVAYSIYKQHKLDWLRAFEAARGRAPDETELASYLCGEGTPRRLATYRHLADAALAAQPPQPPGQARPSPAQPVPEVAPEYGGRAALMERTGLTAGQLAIYGLIAVIFVVGVLLALRFTATPPR